MRASAIACLVLCACGGGGSGPTAPVITSFASSASTVAAGGSVQLTAVFSGGTGSIDRGVGAVTSGVAVSVSPTQNTTYTLTVVDAKTSATSTSSATVIVTGGGACIGSSLLTSLGKTNLMAGTAWDNLASGNAADSATWDLRYEYVSSELFAGSAPCSRCDTNCSDTSNKTCDNKHGCNWWGCYQYDQNPPGEFVRDFVSAAKAKGQLPWLTYYVALGADGYNEGSAEINALNNASISVPLLADMKFFFQQFGSEKGFAHIEPDFWGYANQINPDPTKIPAKVQEFSECHSQPENLVGWVGCIFQLARTYAPNVKVGLHGSSWGTGTDVGLNKDPSLNVPGESKKLADFLIAAGAGAGDFIAVDASDRDYGYYATVPQPPQNTTKDTKWDPTNASLPDFHQAFDWVQNLAQDLGLPIFFWQVPVGNESLNNTENHYKDNRVDYFYTHTAELAAAHVAGMLFGAGNGDTTTPETDGGNLLSRETTYQSSLQLLCQ